MHRSVFEDGPHSMSSFLDTPVGYNQKYDFESIRINMAIDCFDIPARSTRIYSVEYFQRADDLLL